MSGKGQVGGSAPDPTVRDRVLDAFVDIVAERGLAHASIDDIAQRANVSKTTLYTRWPDRRSLVIDGFDRVARRAPVIDPDATFDDMFGLILSYTSSEAVEQRLRQLLAELIATAGVEDEVRSALHANNFGWRAAVVHMIELGKSEGKIPADRDTEVAAEVAMAVVTMRQLIGDRPIDETLVALVRKLLCDPHPY